MFNLIQSSQKRSVLSCAPLERSHPCDWDIVVEGDRVRFGCPEPLITHLGITVLVMRSAAEPVLRHALHGSEGRTV